MLRSLPNSRLIEDPVIVKMERVPEPELMDSEEQARAYALADFSEPHQRFVELYREIFPTAPAGEVLDLGCGPADVTIRFAKAFPDCQILGLDAGPNMLKQAGRAISEHGLQNRVSLLKAYLPGARLPKPFYDAVISNSLLHHLKDPCALWDSVLEFTGSEAPVFVMDLMRPGSIRELDAMVERYAGREPTVLQRDFRNSLAAAYRVDEVRTQLNRRGLNHLRVEAVSDRHLAVWGYAA